MDSAAAAGAQIELLPRRWFDHTRHHGAYDLVGMDGRWAEVTIEQRGAVVRLVADVRTRQGPGAAWHDEQTLHVELGLTHPTVATLNGHWTPIAFDGGATRHGVLGDAAEWLSSALGRDGDALAMELCDGDGDLVEDIEVRETHGEVERICDRVAMLAMAHADVAAMILARTLAADAQFFAYSALVDDADRRTRQLLRTCPALWSLASGLCPHVGEGAAYLDGVRRGRKLNSLIAEMLARADERFEAGRVRNGGGRVALVRSAPSMPFCDLMRAIGAPGADVNDLRASMARRHEWFQVMSEWGMAASALDGIDVARFGGFVSKYAAKLGAAEDISLMPIVDWVQRSSVPAPDRTASLERVRDEVDAWHRTLHEEAMYCPEARLARAPKSGRSIPDVNVEALRTVGDLVDEGRRMRHCVASLAQQAIAGRVHIFRGTIDSVRATIAVDRAGGGYRLVEASGFANAKLDALRMALLRFWVETLA